VEQRGFTLIELLIATAFIGVLGGLVSATTYLTFKTSAETNSQLDVATNVATSSLWLARDVHRAITTDIVDGAAAVGSANFTWSASGSLTTCSYTNNSGELIRVCGGASTVIGRGVSSLTFARNVDLITISYLVSSGVVPPDSELVQLTLLLGGG
jgi:prepilin-type N-terminal cleavage/methylation domain-containing protein